MPRGHPVPRPHQDSSGPDQIASVHTPSSVHMPRPAICTIIAEREACQLNQLESDPGVACFVMGRRVTL